MKTKLIAILVIALLISSVAHSNNTRSQLQSLTAEHTEEMLALKAQHLIEVDSIHVSYEKVHVPLEVIQVELTFYCNCKKCTPGHNITASGTVPAEGRTAATDPSFLPTGTRFYVEGFGWRIAEDTGSGVDGPHVDVYVADHERALQLGRQTAFIVIEKGTL